MSNEVEILPKQFSAIPHFVANDTVDSACKEAGISRETYYKWLKNPVFKSELNRVRNEIVNCSINQLKSYTIKAVTTLSLLLERNDMPSVQRAAAHDILSFVARFKELELEDRIEKLESSRK